MPSVAYLVPWQPTSRKPRMGAERRSSELRVDIYEVRVCGLHRAPQSMVMS